MDLQKQKGYGGLAKESFLIEKNDSNILIPFYLNHELKKRNQVVLNNIQWETETVSDYYYLARHINAIINNKSKNICTFYKLKDQMRAFYHLPGKAEKVHMKSMILSDINRNSNETCEEFDFYLSDIRVIYFATGIGFLLLEIQHMEQDILQSITDKCFSLARIFTNEHDSGKKSSKLEFTISEGKKTLSLKNSVMELLHLNEVTEDDIQLFPSMPNRRCNVYHRIILEEKQAADEQFLYYLRRGLHSSSLYGDESGEWNNSDYTYSPVENIYWSVCQNGIVSLSYKPQKNRNDSFVLSAFPRNVKRDYFFLYVLLLHEREALLLYNAKAVLQWNNTKKLVAMRKELIDFNVCYAYNTVSVEMAYQNFYDCVYRSMCLDKLETDIKNVIAQVDEYQRSNSEGRTNGMLAVIAFLSIFSTFLDGYDLSETIRTYQNFSFINWISIGINLMAIIIAVMIYVRKK